LHGRNSGNFGKLCVLTGVGAGIGISVATSKAVDAVARQPEAADKIRNIVVLVRRWQKLLQYMDL